MVIIMPKTFKMLGTSKNINNPKIVAEVGSAPLHIIVAFPFSI